MSVAKRPRFSSAQPSLLSIAQDRNDGNPPTHSWALLPLELLMRIFLYLKPKDKSSVAFVCNHWHRALNIPILWSNSWVNLTPGLSSRPKAFWNLLKQRCLTKFCVSGISCTRDINVLNKHYSDLVGLKVMISHLHSKGTFELDILHSFSALEILHLEFKEFTSGKWITSLKLSEMKSLLEIKLSGISDLGMCDLNCVAHPTVERLAIKRCGSFRPKDTNKIVLQFPKLLEFSVLECVYYRAFVEDNKPELRECLTHVRHLDLSRTSIDGGSVNFSQMFGNLQYINLLFCLQTPSQLTSILSRLPLLKEMHLRGNMYMCI